MQSCVSNNHAKYRGYLTRQVVFRLAIEMFPCWNLRQEWGNLQFSTKNHRFWSKTTDLAKKIGPWVLGSFGTNFMKSGRFHAWNSADFMKSSESHEIWQISCMKFGGFHEIRRISWQGLIYTAYPVDLYWFWWKIQH